MKKTLNRRQILHIAVATRFLNNIIAMQNTNPKVTRAMGFEIRLPGTTMYRVGRNMQKIEKPWELIVEEEKKLLEKYTGKYNDKGQLVFAVSAPKDESKKAAKAAAKAAKEPEPEYKPDKEKEEAYMVEWDAFLDDEKCTEEFNFIELTEELFEGGTGLTWDNFFENYQILIAEPVED